MRLLIAVLMVMCFSGVAGADVTLSWNAPTENEDGSPLTDLAGFKIYEVAAGAHTEVVDIPATESGTVITKGPGERCYVATAYDDETPANEGGYSNEVCKDTVAPKTFILTIK